MNGRRAQHAPSTNKPTTAYDSIKTSENPHIYTQEGHQPTRWKKKIMALN